MSLLELRIFLKRKKMRKPYNGNKPITSEFGNRRFQLSNGSWYSDFHTGIDIGGVFDVVAAADGNVIGIATNGIDRGGALVSGTPANFVILDHGSGVISLYWHLGAVNVALGQRVSEGQKIGVSGRTGEATGHHLHFAIKVNGTFINPRDRVSFNSETLPVNNNTMNGEFITVQDGEGLFSVAARAGLPANAEGAAIIYSLNQGWRGSWDWVSLNKRMGGGDSLRVRAATPTPTPTPVDNSAEIKKLKDQLTQLEKAKAEAEAKAKTQMEAVELKAKELDEKRAAEIAKLTEEKIKEKETLTAEIQRLDSELEELAKHSIKLPENTELADFATKVIVSELKSRNVKQAWGNWVDKTFKSNVLRSFLKYDWVYMIFIIAGWIAVAGTYYTGTNVVLLGLSGGATAIGSFVVKYIVTNYDKNKDGEFNIQDLASYNDIMGSQNH